MPSPWTLGFLICFLAVLNQSKCSADDWVRTVAISEQAALGAGEGVRLAGFGPPSINSTGQLAFFAHLGGDGVGSGNSHGVWREAALGDLVMVARKGDPAPDSNEIFQSISNHVGFNDEGQIAIDGTTDGFAPGIWSSREGTLAPVTGRTGFPPGTISGVTYSSLDTPAFNSAGQMVFRGGLSHIGPGVDSLNDSGIWSEDSGSDLLLIAREGDVYPGGGEDGVFLDFDEPVLNDKGQLAFSASIAIPGFQSTASESIWTKSAGEDLRALASYGNPVPGIADDYEFRTLGGVAINNRGDIVFSASFSLEDEQLPRGNGLWISEFAGDPKLVVRDGSLAQGTAQASFRAIGPAVLNHHGKTAFYGFLDLNDEAVDISNDHGIWKEDNAGTLKLIAREGSLAPGVDGGLVFGNLRELVFNQNGQVAFSGGLREQGTFRFVSDGIWAENALGNLQLIAVKGGMLDVSDNAAEQDLRVIEQLLLSGGSGNEDGRSSGFNEAGQVAFWARFTDGSSGLFVSNLVAVPEPSGCILLGMTAFLWSIKSFRNRHC